MMEWPDLKIEPIAEYIKDLTRKGGEAVDGFNLDVWFIIIALFTIAFFLKRHGKSVDKTNDRLKSNNENLDNHTDSIIDNTRVNQELVFIKKELLVTNREIVRGNRDLLMSNERLIKLLENSDANNKKLHS